MEKDRLALPRSEVNRQLKLISEIYARLQERAEPQNDRDTDSLAYQLHNLYCGFEDLFEIVASHFENHIDPNGGYHSALLNRMALDIEGVRPALISEESRLLLDNLRAFRHVFRHAYGYVLDRRKLRLVLEDAQALESRYYPRACYRRYDYPWYAAKAAWISPRIGSSPGTMKTFRLSMARVSPTKRRFRRSRSVTSGSHCSRLWR